MQETFLISDVLLTSDTIYKWHYFDMIYYLQVTLYLQMTLLKWHITYKYMIYKLHITYKWPITCTLHITYKDPLLTRYTLLQRQITYTWAEWCTRWWRVWWALWVSAANRTLRPAPCCKVSRSQNYGYKTIKQENLVSMAWNIVYNRNPIFNMFLNFQSLDVSTVEYE